MSRGDLNELADLFACGLLSPKFLCRKTKLRSSGLEENYSFFKNNIALFCDSLNTAVLSPPPGASGVSVIDKKMAISLVGWSMGNRNILRIQNRYLTRSKQG